MRDFDDCRPYVYHLMEEHRRLHALVGRIRAQAFEDRKADCGATLPALAAELRNTRSELVRHFAQEEQGGCLEEGVSRCPRLSREAKRIESEHPLLVAELDCLIAEAMGGPETLPARLALERRIDDFCEQLAAHEAAETALLCTAFGVNVNEIEPVLPDIDL